MNLNPLDLATLALATWYLAYALTKTSGPFHLFALLRERVSLGGLTTCIVCASPWIAGGLYLLWLTPLQPIVVILAVAGLALMAGSYTGANHVQPSS